MFRSIVFAAVVCMFAFANAEEKTCHKNYMRCHDPCLHTKTIDQNVDEYNVLRDHYENIILDDLTPENVRPCMNESSFKNVTDCVLDRSHEFRRDARCVTDRANDVMRINRKRPNPTMLSGLRATVKYMKTTYAFYYAICRPNDSSCTQWDNGNDKLSFRIRYICSQNRWPCARVIHSLEKKIND